MKIRLSITLESMYWSLYKIARHNRILFKLFTDTSLRLDAERDSLMKILPSLSPPGAIIYDIGAYVGFYSIYLAKKTSNTTIYSFEPNPISYAALECGIRSYSYEGRIVPMNIGLGSNKSKLNFFISSYYARSSFLRPNAERGGNRVVSIIEVDCVDIDCLVQNRLVKPPDIMKIDVEGYECEVLKGAQNTIRSMLPLIAIEPHRDASGVSSREKIIEFLKPFGYQFRDVGYHLLCYVKR